MLITGCSREQPKGGLFAGTPEPWVGGKAGNRIRHERRDGIRRKLSYFMTKIILADQSDMMKAEVGVPRMALKRERGFD